eukprot:7034963-Prymnesium_polylepis.1
MRRGRAAWIYGGAHVYCTSVTQSDLRRPGFRRVVSAWWGARPCMLRLGDVVGAAARACRRAGPVHVDGRVSPPRETAGRDGCVLRGWAAGSDVAPACAARSVGGFGPGRQTLAGHLDSGTGLLRSARTGVVVVCGMWSVHAVGVSPGGGPIGRETRGVVVWVSVWGASGTGASQWARNGTRSRFQSSRRRRGRSMRAPFDARGDIEVGEPRGYTCAIS